MSFARKLSLTAAILACGTRKELCARFRAVNPTTEFELEPSFKWLQGRASPRSAQIYEDWVQVLGLPRSGRWIAGCSTDAFLAEICLHFSADPADLAARASAFAGDAWVGSERVEDGADTVCGSYLCYSWAWSPYQREMLIRGVLTIDERKRGRLQARYCETLPDGALVCEGEAFRNGSVLHTAVAAAGRGGHERLFFSLLVPGRPINLLCGQMQGVIISGPEPRPSSGRVLMLRIAPTRILAPPCYVAATRSALAANLAEFALPPIRPETLSAAVLSFLDRDSVRPIDQVTFAELARLSTMLDAAVRVTGH